MEQINSLLEFLDCSHSVYHAVAALTEQLHAAGYTCLQETEKTPLVPGGKYYLTRGESALVAFRVPVGTPKGFLISAAHADRPCFQVKENAELAEAYIRLSVEKYGGMLIAPWLDRPLSVAGRVIVGTETGVESRLVDIDRELLLIPNVAIHMNRKANEGYTWNPAVDTIPLFGNSAAAGSFQKLLETAAGGKVLGHDLYLYPRQKATVWGAEGEFVSAAALDDLACAWCCTQGFLKAAPTDNIPVLCVFDSEEVGSTTRQGAAADLLESTLRRICTARNLDMDSQLAKSFLVSADNGHALHPNHPELSDKNNAPLLNGGVVVKFNANRRYTTDGMSAAIFRKICQKAQVPVQTYYNRADIAGGSTLGNISLSQVAVSSVDIGLAQLAMHSCYETAGVQDVIYMEKAMQAYYETNLEMTEYGCAI